jgi:hypothetical protein
VLWMSKKRANFSSRSKEGVRSDLEYSQCSKRRESRMLLNALEDVLDPTWDISPRNKRRESIITFVPQRYSIRCGMFAAVKDGR